MHTETFKGGTWPTPLQTLLLRACLEQGENTVSAWKEWRQLADIDHLDQGSFRLLPLLYHNLQQNGVDDPLMPRLKGIYRKSWYKNQMLFHAAAKVLQTFQAADIPTVLLKGVALSHAYYKDHGLRPMSDFDVLVPIKQAREAVELLAASGLKPKPTPSAEVSIEIFQEPYFHLTSGYGFTEGNAYEVDLHWYAIHSCYYPEADNNFWEGATPTVFAGIEASLLQPADMLLHVCVHGYRWNIVPPLRWIADAMMILRIAEDRMDWQRLIQEAKVRRLILPIRFTLDYLATEFHAPVPPKVLQILASTPVTYYERFEYTAQSQAPNLLRKLIPFEAIFTYFRHKSSRNKSHWYKMNPANFMQYLRYTRQLDSNWQLLRWITARLFQRFSKFV